MKKILSIVLILLMLICNTIFAFAADKITVRITDTKGNEITGDKKVNAGDKIVMEYLIKPEDIDAPQKKDTDVDITFVVDLSKSMTNLEGGETKIDIEKREINSFLDSLEAVNNINAKISIVGFESNIRVDKSQLSIQEAKNVVNGLTAVGSTNGGYGLKTAYYNNLSNKSDSQKFVIYLSDGQNTSYSINNGNYKKNQFNITFKNYGKMDNKVYDGVYKSYLNNLSHNDFYMENGRGYSLHWLTYNIYEVNGVRVYEHLDDSCEPYAFKDAGLVDGKFNWRDYVFDLTVYHSYCIYDNTLPKQYAYKVADQLISGGNANISKTYVVGIGDESNGDQKTENKTIAGLANGLYNWIPGKPAAEVVSQTAEKELEDLYFPLANASGLRKAFNNIIDDIANSLHTTENKISIPFANSMVLKKQSAVNLAADTLIVDSVLVEEIIDEKTNKTKVLNSDFSIKQENVKGEKAYVLSGALKDGFTYRYKEDLKKYVANPVRVKIAMTVPEGFSANTIEVKDGGKFMFKADKKGYTLNLPAKSFNIFGNAVNLVDAKLTIDEFLGSYKLELTPLVDGIKKITVVANKNDKNAMVKGWHYTNPGKGANLGELEMKSVKGTLDKNKCFYLWIEYGTGNYYERVEVLTNEGINNNINGKVDFYREKDMPDFKNVGFKIGAGNPVDISGAAELNLVYGSSLAGNNNYSFKKTGNVYEIPMGMYDMDYLKDKSKAGSNYNKDGKNKVTVDVVNLSDNKTILIAAVEAHTKGPKLDNIRIEDGFLKADIVSKYDFLKGSAFLYNEYNDMLGSYELLEDGGKRSIKANLNNNQLGNYVDPTGLRFEIRPVDVNMNGSITDYTVDSVNVEAALINPSDRKFLEDTSKIVSGTGYSYGIKVNYAGGDIVLETSKYGTKEVVSSNAVSFTVYTSDGKKQVGSRSTNITGKYSNKITIRPQGLNNGEYIIVVNCIFDTSKYLIKGNKIQIKTTYKGNVSTKSYSIDNNRNLE